MEKIKVGIIGLGAIFKMHENALTSLDNIKITAVCDIVKELAKEKAEKLNCKAYTSYKEMIDNEGLDAVHILTPHYLHPEMAIYAMEAGVNVLTEKPMAISEDKALLMIETAEKTGKNLGVIFQNRYNKSSRFVKELINTHKYGKMIGVRFNVNWFRDTQYYKGDSWRGKWATEGGGVIINQAIHTLDLANWFISSTPTLVNASINNRSLKGIIEVEDEAEGLIKYENGVKLAFYICNYYANDSEPEIEITFENATVLMKGSKKVFIMENGDNCELKQFEEEKTIGKLYWGTSHRIQIKAYYEALSSGKKLEIDGLEALKTHKLMYKIYESANLGKELTF